MEARREPSGLRPVAIEIARPSINETLMGFFVSQKKELSSLRRQIAYPQDFESILSWYLKSDKLNQAEKEFEEDAKDLDIRMLGKRRGPIARLSGRIFQDINYVSLALNQPESKILLSPKRMLSLFKVLFPKAVVVEHPQEQSSLSGKHVPDSAIIYNPKGSNTYLIEEVIDYTFIKSGGRKEDFGRKLNLFRMQQQDPDAPYAFDFLGNTDMVFIIPKISKVNQKAAPLTTLSKFNVQESPFTRLQIVSLREESLARIIKRINSPRRHPVGTVAGV